MIYCVELFSGNADITKRLNQLPNVKCKSVDYNADFKPDICIDVFDIRDLAHLAQLCGFPRIDFVWASPDCTSYSLASHGIHRKAGGIAVSDYAKLSDKLNYHLWNDILNNSIYYIVENPRAHYAKMSFCKYTKKITIYYSQYGMNVPKPTDLMSNDLNLGCFFDTRKPPKMGVTCGSTIGLGGVSGFLNRCKMPERLIDDIAKYVSSLPTIERKKCSCSVA